MAEADLVQAALPAEPASRETQPLLRTERLSKTYTDGMVAAVNEVNLQIEAGESVAIVGKSGSGKSTLLNLLGGLDRPTSGEVYFRGQPLSGWKNLDRFRSENLGFVFQSFCLLPVLTAVENVQVPMLETSRPAAERRRRALELLDIVGIAHRAAHLPKALSVGERQRVAIARALANDPALLLADEPTGNLDTQTARAVFELLSQLHRQRHMTLVVITHDAELAARAERIVRMQDGRIV